ncbi:hypothetical protein [Nocardioides sp.]|uniref:hypothetical protein n=1 Tax=Nocardioides sp. TaxID=35761 RepID=UPI0039E61C07
MRILGQVAVEEVRVGDNGRELTAAVASGAGDLLRVLGEFERDAIKIYDIGLRRPTLDDVFLSLTGHQADETSTEEDE